MARPDHAIKKRDKLPQVGRYREPFLAATFIVVATLIAYLPAIRAGYIWDDNDYVENNINLRSAQGLADTWFSPQSLPQYYPLVHTSFWIEYHLWGLNPLGYHLVNVLLHICSALLLLVILKKLQVPGAPIAACIFSLHPVMVESVAWVTERKNVLSCALYLAAGYVYLFRTQFGLGRDRESWGAYTLALIFFLCALWSKTVTATFPAAILLLLWWKNGRLRFRDIYPLLPFFILGVALGAVTEHLERYHVGASGERIVELRLSVAQRCLIAGRAIWFYAWKLIWPAKLTFIYPRWNSIDDPTAAQSLYPIGVLVVIATLFALRNRIGRGPLTAVLFFCGTLFPALGFVNVYPMRFSYVADHFQYLASIGLTTLAGAAVCRWLSNPIWLRWSARALILAALGTLTFNQCKAYKNAERLWRDTLSKNPGSWMVYVNLGHVLRERQNYDEAEKMYDRALELAPNLHDTHADVGMMHGLRGRNEQAIDEFKKALAIEPNFAPAHYGLGQIYARQAKLANAIDEYQKALAIAPGYPEANYRLALLLQMQGKTDEALLHYRTAVANKPQYFESRYDLGTLLIDLGRLDEAIYNLREAVRINPTDARAWTNLGAAQLKSGHSADAVISFQQALKIDPTLVPAQKGLDAAMGRGGR